MCSRTHSKAYARVYDKDENAGNPARHAAPSASRPSRHWSPVAESQGRTLRAFVVYLRSVQGIPLARLSHVLRDLFGLEMSEGALVDRFLSASRKPFAAQTA